MERLCCELQGVTQPIRLALDFSKFLWGTVLAFPECSAYFPRLLREHKDVADR
jgi:hypothetical protein